MPSPRSTHNLLAALVDNALRLFAIRRRLIRGASTWVARARHERSCAQREMVIVYSGRGNGQPREASVDITAASEIMAILTLAHGVTDLQARLARIVVGTRADGTPVRAQDLGAADGR